MNTYLILFLVLIALLVITFITSLYIRKYEKADLVIAIYVVFVTISQFIAARITFFDFGLFSFSAPAAVIIFPFTFQLTDQINERFGFQETRKMILIAFFTQILTVFFSFLAVSLVQLNTNPETGGFSSEAFDTIFYSSIRITIASWIAFLISELLDARIFHKLKEITKEKHLWLRNVFSDILSLFVDSIVFVPLAFIGKAPWVSAPIFTSYSILSLILGQIFTKWIFGLIDTPGIYLSRWLMFGQFEKKFSWINRFNPE